MKKTRPCSAVAVVSSSPGWIVYSWKHWRCLCLEGKLHIYHSLWGGEGGGGGEGVGGGRTGGPVSTTDIPLSGARTSETEGNPRKASSCGAPFFVLGSYWFPILVVSTAFPPSLWSPSQTAWEACFNKQAHQVNQLWRALSAVCVTSGWGLLWS